MDSYKVLDVICDLAFAAACALVAVPVFPIPILDRPMLALSASPSAPVPELSATPSDLSSLLSPSHSVLPITPTLTAPIFPSTSKRSSSTASLFTKVTRRSINRSMSTVSGDRPSFNNLQHLVKLYPGNVEGYPFVVHKSFATFYSPVLKAAFGSGFHEGIYQEYRFNADFDSNVFRIFVEWLYTQTIQLDIDVQQKKGELISDEEHREQAGLLTRLWVLADQLMIPSLQNGAIRRLSQLCDDDEDTLPIDECHWISESTSESSLLRAWFISRFGLVYTPEMYVKHGQRFPQDMMINMLSHVALNEELDGEDSEKLWDVSNFLVPEN